MAGRVVRRLPVGPDRSATSGVVWDGRDDVGRSLAPGIYLVRLGDTLSLVSHRYGTTMETIIVANGLFSNEIRVGQLLLIPIR